MSELENTAASTFELSDAVKKEIDHWLTKYPPDQRRSAVVSALLAAQTQNEGWLSEPVMNAVADYLAIPRIEVYEVATFYDMYNLKPVGKHKIAVCTNLSCQLRGSEKIVAHLKKRLGAGLGETTSDGQFTLQEVECLAACGGAPMCQVNDQAYHENLTPEKMDEIINSLMSEGDA